MNVKSGQLTIAEQATNHIHCSLALGEHVRSLCYVRSFVNNLVSTSEQSGDVGEKYLLKNDETLCASPKGHVDSQWGTAEETVDGIGKMIKIVLSGEKSK